MSLRLRSSFESFVTLVVFAYSSEVAFYVAVITTSVGSRACGSVMHLVALRPAAWTFIDNKPLIVFLSVVFPEFFDLGPIVGGLLNVLGFLSFVFRGLVDIFCRFTHKGFQVSLYSLSQFLFPTLIELFPLILCTPREVLAAIYHGVCHLLCFGILCFLRQPSLFKKKAQEHICLLQGCVCHGLRVIHQRANLVKGRRDQGSIIKHGIPASFHMRYLVL